jgi:acyl-CoA thioester hydrolase
MQSHSSYKNILPVQVRFSDVDMMGHVSNTVYQSYYDAGKLQYFDEVTPDMDFINIGVVGASIKIDYIQPIFIRTQILVKTRVAVLGRKSMTMEHCLTDAHTGEILSTCSAVLVCYAVKEQKSIPIPDHWRENIMAYEDHVVLT